MYDYSDPSRIHGNMPLHSTIWRNTHEVPLVVVCAAYRRGKVDTQRRQWLRQSSSEHYDWLQQAMLESPSSICLEAQSVLLGDAVSERQMEGLECNSSSTLDSQMRMLLWL